MHMPSYASKSLLLLLEPEWRHLEPFEGPREVDDVLQSGGLQAGEDAGQRGQGAGAGGLAQRSRGAVERLGQDAELARPAVDPLLLRLVRRPRAVGRLLGNTDAA